MNIRTRLAGCFYNLVFLVAILFFGIFVFERQFKDRASASVVGQAGPTPTNTPVFLYPLIQRATLIPSSNTISDRFGSAVAINGSTVVVGAPYMDSSGLNDSGAAYVYVLNGTLWEQQAELVASDTRADDYFGYAVSIYENTIVVGAHGDDDKGSEAGAAYIFTRQGTTWTQQQKLTANDGGVGDRFGWSVSIDDLRVLVGAYGENSDGTDAGAAYVFDIDGSLWSQSQKLVPADVGANKRFGYAVDIHDSYAIIGAPNTTSVAGDAYIFEYSGSPNFTWNQAQKLVSSLAQTGDGFGSAVAVHENYAIVGSPLHDRMSPFTYTDAGAFSIFKRNDTTWEQLSTPYIGAERNDMTGHSVDISHGLVIVGIPYGNPFDYRSGYAHANDSISEIFTYDSSEYDLFGWSVARDNKTMIAGAPQDDYAALTDPGVAYIFTVNLPPTYTPTLSPTPTRTPNYIITPTKTNTPYIPYPSSTPTHQPTLTLTSTPTNTPTHTATPTSTPTFTPTPTMTNTPITATSPPNATAGTGFYTISTPTLTWSLVSWAMGYHIQVDDDPIFGSPIDAEVSAETLIYTTPDLPNGTYYWRVQAKRSATTWGNWSAIEVFVVSVG